MSVIQAVLLGILGGLGIWDSRVMGLCMMERRKLKITEN